MSEVLLGCTSRKGPEYFPRLVINRVSDLGSIEPVPPPVFNSTIFIVSSTDSVLETTFALLKQLYSISYENKYPTLSDFLYIAINQGLKINIDQLAIDYYFTYTFKLNDAISLIYSTYGVDELIKRYLLIEGDSYKLKNRSLSINQIKTVSYYLFLNQFITIEDDYLAETYFKRLTELMPIQK